MSEMPRYTVEDFEDAALAAPSGVQTYQIVKNGQGIQRAFYFQDLFQQAAETEAALVTLSGWLKANGGVSDILHKLGLSR